MFDRNWDRVVQQVRLLLKDEDGVVLPQVFGLEDPSVPERIRQGIPARVVFAGTMPPSVPGIRTQLLLKRRYEVLGGTYLGGEENCRYTDAEGWFDGTALARRVSLFLNRVSGGLAKEFNSILVNTTRSVVFGIMGTAIGQGASAEKLSSSPLKIDEKSFAGSIFLF